MQSCISFTPELWLRREHCILQITFALCAEKVSRGPLEETVQEWTAIDKRVPSFSATVEPWHKMKPMGSFGGRSELVRFLDIRARGEVAERQRIVDFVHVTTENSCHMGSCRRRCLTHSGRRSKPSESWMKCSRYLHIGTSAAVITCLNVHFLSFPSPCIVDEF